MGTKIIAVANQKGGVGKTTTALNLGVALRERGLRVLLVDLDHQASLTCAAGVGLPDELDNTVATLLDAVMERRLPDYDAIIRHCDEGVDVIPSNVLLANVDMKLSTVTVAREHILGRALEPLRDRYDAILLDCAPALNMITVNDLVAADGVIIPIAPQYLSYRGLDMLLGTIIDARAVNPGLALLGVLVTMREKRRRGQDEIETALRGQLVGELNVFDATIPKSVRAEEAPGHGRSLLSYDPHGAVAEAYRSLAAEIAPMLDKPQVPPPYPLGFPKFAPARREA